MNRTRISAWCALLLTVMSVACEKSEYVYDAPKIYFSSSAGYELGLTDSIVLQPKILYDYNSTYTWTQNGLWVSDKLNYTFRPSGLADYELVFTVVNSLGADTSTVGVSVVKNIDFESVDSVRLTSSAPYRTEAPAVTGGVFVADSVRFANSSSDDPKLWKGFALTRQSMTSLLDSTAIYHVHCSAASAASSASGSTTTTASGTASAVFAPGPAPVDVLFERAYTPKSIAICNTSFVFLTSKNGYEAASIEPYKQDDYLKLIIKGVDSNGAELSRVETFLIDCRYNNPAKYMRLSAWETVVLSDLGLVEGLKFELESTRTNAPLYVCLDYLKLQD